MGRCLTKYKSKCADLVNAFLGHPDSLSNRYPADFVGITDEPCQFLSWGLISFGLEHDHWVRAWCFKKSFLCTQHHCECEPYGLAGLLTTCKCLSTILSTKDSICIDGKHPWVKTHNITPIKYRKRLLRRRMAPAVRIPSHQMEIKRIITSLVGKLCSIIR